MHRLSDCLTGQIGQLSRDVAQLLGRQRLSQPGEPDDIGEGNCYRTPSWQPSGGPLGRTDRLGFKRMPQGQPSKFRDD